MLHFGGESPILLYTRGREKKKKMIPLSQFPTWSDQNLNETIYRHRERGISHTIHNELGNFVLKAQYLHCLLEIVSFYPVVHFTHIKLDRHIPQFSFIFSLQKMNKLMEFEYIISYLSLTNALWDSKITCDKQTLSLFVIVFEINL